VHDRNGFSPAKGLVACGKQAAVRETLNTSYHRRDFARPPLRESVVSSHGLGERFAEKGAPVPADGDGELADGCLPRFGGHAGAFRLESEELPQSNQGSCPYGDLARREWARFVEMYGLESGSSVDEEPFVAETDPRGANAPIVSIIIPTYNRARLLCLAIESVVHQTYRHWELWICDDGSTDDTAAAVQPYLVDPRTRYIPCSHTGLPAAARNVGLERATGKYVAFLDSDDLWLPSKLAEQVEAMEREPEAGVCSANAYAYWEREPSEVRLLLREGQAKSGAVLDTLILDNYVVNCTAMVRREILGKSGFFSTDPEVVEDYDLWVRVCAVSHLAYLDKPLAIYRVESSDSFGARDTWEKQRLRLLHVFRHLDGFLADRGILGSFRRGPLETAVEMRWGEVFETRLSSYRWGKALQWMAFAPVLHPYKKPYWAAKRLLRYARARVRRGWGIKRTLLRVFDTARAPLKILRYDKFFDKNYGCLRPEPGKIHVLCMMPWIGAGGAERVMLNIARFVDPDRFCFHVCADSPDGFGWRSEYERTFANVLQPGNLPPALFRRFLRRIVRQLDISIVFISDSRMGIGFLPTLRSEFPHIAAADVMHSKESPGVIDEHAWVAPLLDRRVCISQDLREHLMGRYALFDVDPDHADCVQVIYNGIDLRELDPARFDASAFRRAQGIPEGAFLACFLGRFSEEKQPRLFVDMARELVGYVLPVPVRFVMAGDGPLRADTERAIAEAGLKDHFVLPGLVQNVGELLASVNALVITSRIEGIPFAGVEALAMGKPVISTDVGALRELVQPDVNGYLEPHDAAAAARLAERLALLIREPDRYQRLAGQARESIMGAYSVDAMAAAYARLFSDILEEARARMGGGRSVRIFGKRRQPYSENRRLDSV